MARVLQKHLALIEAHQPPANRALVHTRPALVSAPGPGEMPWLYARAGLTDWIHNPGLGALDMEPTYVSTLDTPDMYSGFGRTALRSKPITAPADPAKKPMDKKPMKTAAKTAPQKTRRKRRGPPPWANASFMRDADSKVARAIPPGVKKKIDELPLSTTKKGKLKKSPVSFLVEVARANPQEVADFIRSARQRGAGVAPPAAGDNPATLAAKLLMAASRPAQAMAGLSGFGAVSSERLAVGALAPALTMLAPVTLPALKSVAAGKVVAPPTKSAIVDSAKAAAKADAMQAAMPPDVTEAAESAAAKEDKIFGLPRNVVLIGGGLGIGLIALRALKR